MAPPKDVGAARAQARARSRSDEGRGHRQIREAKARLGVLPTLVTEASTYA